MNFRPSLQCHFWPFGQTGQTETGESFAGFFPIGDSCSRVETLKRLWFFLAFPTPFSELDTISDVKDIWLANPSKPYFSWVWAIALSALVLLIAWKTFFPRKRNEPRIATPLSKRLQTLDSLQRLSETQRTSFSAEAFYMELHHVLFDFLLTRLNGASNLNQSSPELKALFSGQMDDKALSQLEEIFFTIRMVKFASFFPDFHQALDDLAKAKAIVDLLGDGESLNPDNL
jgi:hypothetical protein